MNEAGLAYYCDYDELLSDPFDFHKTVHVFDQPLQRE